MPRSLAQIYLHLVFSTKNRTPFLRDDEIRAATHAYLAGACKNLGCHALRVGGVADHVHLACRFSRNVTVADFLRDLKRESSKWLKVRSPDSRDFQWQEGYGAFSVSPSHVSALLEYIANQEAHHKKETFQEEFLRLLDKYGVEVDERFLWD
jgi:REP element-mobilizing transposase RayT